jgi:ribosomal protein L24E
LGGCSSAKNSGTAVVDPQPGQTANLVCPMSGKLVAVGAGVPTRNFDGKVVGFCCAKCPAQWDNLPDTEKKIKLSAAMDKQGTLVANTKCPIEGGAINKDIEMRIFDGKIVGFCCAACPPQWDKLSDADKKAKLDAAMK